MRKMSADPNRGLEPKLAQLLSRYEGRADTNEVRFALASPSRGWRWEWSSPGSKEQYFIASTTKLYTVALIMQLRYEGQLDLDESAATYLGSEVMEGIHLLNGVDSSDTVTVRQLLAHTSGIADYFEQRWRDGSTLIQQSLREDVGWTFEDALLIAKTQMSPKFAPGTPRRAFYSDTNYQLLGRIIENLTGARYEVSLAQRILTPLGLVDTYGFAEETLDRYDSVATMLYGTQPVVLPHSMASFRADGGVVSTARDGITFLEAFMTGGLFPAEYLDEMQREWNPILQPAPLQYGVGIMRFALPRYYTLSSRVPPGFGHSGASGAVLFHTPALDLYVSGTVNQIKKRGLSYNLMARVVLACQDAW